MVKGGDSLSEGCEFESCRRILDGHFLTFIFCKKLYIALFEEDENKRKRGRGWPIFLKKLKIFINGMEMITIQIFDLRADFV